MRSNGFAKLFIGSLLAAAITAGSLAATPSIASAQTCTGVSCTPVRPDGKGMIGLGLLGGELGLFIPALVQNAMRTNEWWPYLVFPLVGIGAGIGGGYALEQATGGWGSRNANQPEISIGIMIAAMVLIVPTVVGTLALASYSPPGESSSGDQDMTVDDTGGDSVEAVHDGSSTSPATPDSSMAPTPSSGTTPAPSTSGGTSLLPTTPSDAVAGGPGLVRFDGNGNRILLGVPTLGAMARYTPEELASMHVLQQEYDMQVPVLSGSF